MQSYTLTLIAHVLYIKLYNRVDVIHLFSYSNTYTNSNSLNVAANNFFLTKLSPLISISTQLLFLNT